MTVNFPRILNVSLCLVLIGLFGCNLQLAPSNDAGGRGFFDAAPAVPTDESVAAAGADAAMRAIEEADILKFDGPLAYALNTFKGLFIIDLANPDNPSIIGTLELKGRPVEMYVAGTRAYIVASSDVYYGPYYSAELGGGPALKDAVPPVDYYGSKVTVVNVANPKAPAAMGDIILVGYANASRRVGDVIYVVGMDTPLSDDVGNIGSDVVSSPDFYRERGFVASINVANPNDIKPVERKTFDGSATNLHVSQTALFATSFDYGAFDTPSNDEPPEAATLVQYIDISDPAGHIRIRGTARVPGTIRNRFYLDDFNGVLRIATESFGFGFRTVRLFTYSLANPDNITPLGQTEIIKNEGLEAVRFDGAKGYLVTFLRRDPLFVVDLTDPAKPTVTGQLDVPGFSTHIEPRGNHLIAVGIDDQNGNRPAVVLYNVADPKNPQQVSRIVLGPPGSFTESQATYDEKAFKIVDEAGLIAMPFQYYKPVEPNPDQPQPSGLFAADYYRPMTCVSAVQLIDYSAEQLKQRGWFEHKGNVERVGMVGTRVYAMSQLGFQTVNIDDRDNPASVKFLPFLGDDEQGFYDPCGGYYPGPIDVFPFFPLDAMLGSIFAGLDPQVLLSALNAFASAIGAGDGTCGAVGVTPVALMTAMWGFMRVSRRRRRR